VVVPKRSEVAPPSVDDLDAGWGDDEAEDEAEEERDAHDDLDAGWDTIAVAEQKVADAEQEKELAQLVRPGLTPEERAARTAEIAERARARAVEIAARAAVRAEAIAARAAERKERARAAALEKKERRKERAQAAAAKRKPKKSGTKGSSARRESRTSIEVSRASVEPQAANRVDEHEEPESAPAMPARTPVKPGMSSSTIAMLAVAVLVAVAAAVMLLKK
jgi:hypothetical protein